MLQCKLVFLCKEVGGLWRRSQTCQQEAHLNMFILPTELQLTQISHFLRRNPQITCTEGSTEVRQSIKSQSISLIHCYNTQSISLTHCYNTQSISLTHCYNTQSISRTHCYNIQSISLTLCYDIQSHIIWSLLHSEAHSCCKVQVKLLFQSSMKTTYSYVDAAWSRLFQSSVETTCGYAEALVPKLHGNHIQLSRYIYIQASSASSREKKGAVARYIPSSSSNAL